MSTIEYHAMSFLRDVAHEGVLCTFNNRSAPDRGKWCGPSGQAAWTVQHVQNHTLLGHSPPFSMARKFMLQPFRGYNVKSTEKPHKQPSQSDAHVT